MPKPRGIARKVRGKTFVRRRDDFTFLEDAQRLAAWYTRHGYLVRIVPRRVRAYGGQRTRYALYTHEK